jgi:hypothetical protein
MPNYEFDETANCSTKHFSTAPWYVYRDAITTLVIEEGITSIGDFAFAFCDKITGDLTLPDGLKRIGFAAFYDCYGFTGSLILPTGLEYICDNAFCLWGRSYGGCYAWNSPIYPEKIFGIKGKDDYFNFTGSLILPEGLISIGRNAFLECNGFTSLTVPEGLTSIGNNAFYECSGFTGSLILPNGLKHIGYHAFSGCYGFNGSLTLPEDIEYISFGVFSGCHGFTGSLILPEGLRIIDEYGFSGCSGFSSLTMPANLNPYLFAFEYCTGLTDVINHSTSPNGTPTIFEGINKPAITLHVPSASLEIYRNDFYWGMFGNIVAIEE